jgi:hypothetical protein
MGRINESGLQNINKLAERYKKCVIYYHQDLDGVFSAIAMREYLKSYGIQIVGSEWTQYGPRTFANDIKPWADDTMMVLVDFANGSPYFTVATDHHDRQIDFDKVKASHGRTSPSNAETIDRIIASNSAFPQDDLDAVSMIDSAGYLKHGITPEEVTKSTMSELEDGKTLAGLTKNKAMLANLVNRLILSYKNKTKGGDKSSKGYLLNRLVMECSPSLVAMYQMITKIAKEEGYDSGLDISKNHADYVKRQKNSENVKYDSERGIIIQYGGGYMIKTGSYNRYTPFKLYPESIFLCIAWPMGLLQVSCNPFKNKMFPDIDLGKIMREIVEENKNRLSKVWTNLEIIKRVSEGELNDGVDAIGYKWDSISSGFLTSFSTDEEVNISDNKIELYIDMGNKPKTYIEKYSNISNKTSKSLLVSNGVSEADVTLDKVTCVLKKVGSKDINIPFYKEWSFDQKISKLIEFVTKNNTSIGDINDYDVNFTIKSKSGLVVINKENQNLLTSASKFSNKYYKDLSISEKNELSKIKVNAYDMIMKSSGGHKAITNMSGFANLMGCNKDISSAFVDLFNKYGILGDGSYVNLLKLMQAIFVEKLSDMVDNEKALGKKDYDSEELIPDLTPGSLTERKVLRYKDFVRESKKN